MKRASLLALTLAGALIPLHCATASPPGQPDLSAGQACGVVPASLLQKTLGAQFDDEPLATKAPPAYDGAWGSSCQYSTRPNSGHRMTVNMLIYAESSPAVAKDTFDKAAVFFADTSQAKPSVGDSAYWQSGEKNASQIHVLKGNVHFSIELEPRNDAQAQALATAVASRL